MIIAKDNRWKPFKVIIFMEWFKILFLSVLFSDICCLGALGGTFIQVMPHKEEKQCYYTRFGGSQ